MDENCGKTTDDEKCYRKRKNGGLVIKSSVHLQICCFYAVFAIIAIYRGTNLTVRHEIFVNLGSKFAKINTYRTPIQRIHPFLNFRSLAIPPVVWNILEQPKRLVYFLQSLVLKFHAKAGTIHSPLNDCKV